MADILQALRQKAGLRLSVRTKQIIRALIMLRVQA
jgi:hypothetical protein